MRVGERCGVVMWEGYRRARLLYACSNPVSYTHLDVYKRQPEYQLTPALLRNPAAPARAELHWRIAPPLLALAFALMAIPLGRSSPRQARYGSVLLAFLAYLVGIFLMMLGTQWIAEGRLPTAAGLWWLLLPMLGLGAVSYTHLDVYKRQPVHISSK